MKQLSLLAEEPPTLFPVEPEREVLIPEVVNSNTPAVARFTRAIWTLITGVEPQ